MKKIILGFVLFTSSLAFSQIDVESVFTGGEDAAQNLLKGYIEPAAAGFGYGMNSGWNTTAKPHKLLGFDISVIASAAFVPKSGENFTFNNSEYIKLDDSNITSAELPTLFGSSKLEDRPLLEFTNPDDSNDKTSISSLPGIGLKKEIGHNVVPTAMVQLGLGLFKNTEIKLRYLPKISQKEYEVSLFGIGVLHDIKQWIPIVKRLPFQFSGFIGFNSLKSKIFLDADNNPDQAFQLNTKTLTYQLLASKQILLLTVYGGLGMSSYNTEVNLLGTYNTDNQSYTDPLNIDYSGQSFRGNLGLSLKLLILKISADYTLQEYNTFSLTTSFTFR